MNSAIRYDVILSGPCESTRRLHPVDSAEAQSSGPEDAFAAPPRPARHLEIVVRSGLECGDAQRCVHALESTGAQARIVAQPQLELAGWVATAVEHCKSATARSTAAHTITASEFAVQCEFVAALRKWTRSSPLSMAMFHGIDRDQLVASHRTQLPSIDAHEHARAEFHPASLPA